MMILSLLVLSMVVSGVLERSQSISCVLMKNVDMIIVTNAAVS